MTIRGEYRLSQFMRQCWNCQHASNKDLHGNELRCLLKGIIVDGNKCACRAFKAIPRAR